MSKVRTVCTIITTPVSTSLRGDYSFFGEQEGPFRLELDYIAAVASENLFRHPCPQPRAAAAANLLVLDSSPKEKEVGPESQPSQASSWLGWISGFFR